MEDESIPFEFEFDFHLDSFLPKSVYTTVEPFEKLILQFLHSISSQDLGDIQKKKIFPSFNINAKKVQVQFKTQRLPEEKEEKEEKKAKIDSLQAHVSNWEGVCDQNETFLWKFSSKEKVSIILHERWYSVFSISPIDPEDQDLFVKTIKTFSDAKKWKKFEIEKDWRYKNGLMDLMQQAPQFHDIDWRYYKKTVNLVCTWAKSNQAEVVKGPL